MELMTKIAWGLIIAGAYVMAISIYRFRVVFRLLDEFHIKEYRKTKRVYNAHQTLMVFFLLGYIAVIYGSIANIEVFGDLFVGIIFFFGAVFVLLGVLFQSKMLSEAQFRYKQETEASASPEIERSKLISANEKLQEEMEEERIALETQLQRARQMEAIGALAS